jgi:hypothetical protein
MTGNGALKASRKKEKAKTGETEFGDISVTKRTPVASR